MSFLELARERYSVRDYDGREVEEEKLRLILEAGRIAPTACNLQPWQVYVVRSREQLDLLAGATNCIYNAPVVLVICANDGKAWKNPYTGHSSGEMDATIAASSMMFEAQELGLGTTWVCLADLEKVKKDLALPEDLTVVALLDIGYPSEKGLPAPLHADRRASEEVFSIL